MTMGQKLEKLNCAYKGNVSIIITTALIMRQVLFIAIFGLFKQNKVVFLTLFFLIDLCINFYFLRLNVKHWKTLHNAMDRRKAVQILNGLLVFMHIQLKTQLMLCCTFILYLSWI